MWWGVLGAELQFTILGSWGKSTYFFCVCVCVGGGGGGCCGAGNGHLQVFFLWGGVWGGGGHFQN